MSAAPPRESRPRRSRAGGVPRELRAVDPGSWTPDTILAALHDWTQTLGRPPRAHEWTSTTTACTATPHQGARWKAEHPRWPSAGTVAHHFGTWSAALHAAGLPATLVEHDLPLPERVAAARALRGAGEPVRAIAEQLGVDITTAYRYLRAGSCKSCGGPAVSGTVCRSCNRTARPAATGEQILQALHAWTVEHDGPPREPDWTATNTTWNQEWPRWPGTSTVLRVFGSWNAALQAADLPTRRYAWTRQQALTAIGEWARQHGRAPRHQDARGEPGLPDQAACERLFGSWNQALRTAGLTPNLELWDDDRVHAALTRWATWHRAQNAGEPSRASYSVWAAAQNEPVPSATSIARRFDGSWNAVRAAAGLRVARAGRPRRVR